MAPGTLTPTDHIAIVSLVHEFYRLIDSGRAVETVSLFTENAKITFGPGSPKPGTIEGGEIAAFMEARQRQALTTRHTIANIMLSEAGSGRVVVDSVLTLFRSSDERRVPDAAFVADIHEIMARQGGGWKIEHRTVTPIFVRE